MKNHILNINFSVALYDTLFTFVDNFNQENEIYQKNLEYL